MPVKVLYRQAAALALLAIARRPWFDWAANQTFVEAVATGA